MIATKTIDVQEAEFWDEVERRSASHALHTHPYFTYLFGESGDINAVKIFSEQFHLFCVTFHRCLGALIAGTSDQELIAMVTENLYDEMGSGNLNESHLEILKRFSRSIGYTETDIASLQPLESTRQLNDAIIEACLKDFYFGLGTVGLGAEFAGARFFENVYKAFQEKDFLKDADLQVYAIHAQDDTRHREHMKKVVRKYTKDEVARARILAGINHSHNLFDKFWTGVGLESGFFRVVPVVAMAAA